ncbi:hypothetical protein J4G02_14545, partial [Candidatus Poribacteria bacterium]|nr:hypothetical protein [Candidatus Poribacteria bacterium]
LVDSAILILKGTGENPNPLGLGVCQLPNHLFNQWYNLCSPNNGDAPNIRFDNNNKQLIQVDNTSFYRTVSIVSWHRKIS